MIKKIILSVLLCTGCMFGMAQNQTITHVIQRGENIESIAEYYKVSIEDICKANPDVNDIVYVGMKLIIPQTQQQKDISKTVTATSTTINTPKSYDKFQTVYTAANNRNSWKLKAIVGVTSGIWTGEDFKNGNTDIEFDQANIKNKAIYQFHIGLVADYIFTENVYAGLGIVFNQSGYKQEYFMTSGQYWDDEGANYDFEQTDKMTTNRFDVPIHIGGMYNFSSDVRLFIEAGPYISYAISGNKKTNRSFTEYDDIHSSATEYINEKEKIGKGSLEDFQKFGYGLSVTAGVSFSNIILQFTYQRGLNKIIKETKQYEQNMLLSLGYEF